MKHTLVVAVLAGWAGLASMGMAHADSLTTGIVNPDGSKQTNGPYTVSHPSTGRYIITLTNYTGAPICLFNIVGDLTRVNGISLKTKTCDVNFENKKGKATDYLFLFYAAPVS